MPFRGKGQNKELTHSCFSCFLMFKDVIVSLPQRMQECFYIFCSRIYAFYQASRFRLFANIENNIR